MRYARMIAVGSRYLIRYEILFCSDPCVCNQCAHLPREGSDELCSAVSPHPSVCACYVACCRSSVVLSLLSAGSRLPRYGWTCGSGLSWAMETTPDSMSVSTSRSHFQTYLGRRERWRERSQSTHLRSSLPATIKVNGVLDPTATGLLSQATAITAVRKYSEQTV